MVFEIRAYGTDEFMTVNYISHIKSMNSRFDWTKESVAIKKLALSRRVATRVIFDSELKKIEVSPTSTPISGAVRLGHFSFCLSGALKTFFFLLRLRNPAGW